MTTCTPDNRCVPPHGNSPESVCADCEAQYEQAREARNTQITAALHTLAEQMPGRMWDYAVSNTLSALVRSLNLDGRCHLCGWHHEHVPGCAAEVLKELID
jgi:hypothetical protein